GVHQLEGPYRQRCFQRESDSSANLSAAGNRVSRNPVLLLVPFLSLRFSQEFGGLPDARFFAGSVGGADGRRTDAATFPRRGRPAGRIPGTDSADVAGHL